MANPGSSDIADGPGRSHKKLRAKSKNLKISMINTNLLLNNKKPDKMNVANKIKSESIETKIQQLKKREYQGYKTVGVAKK